MSKNGNSEPRARLGRLPSALVNPALAIGFLLISLLAAEALTRVLMPQQLILIRPDIWQPVDTLGWTRRPHVQTTINTGERTVTIYTDSAGFRVGRAGRQPGRRQVLLLGDSFMEALQVEHEQSFAGLLEERLSRLPDGPVAVRNAAVAGWRPNHYYLAARSLLARDTFEVVVVMLYLANDVTPDRSEYIAPRAAVERHAFRWPRRMAWKEIVNAWLYPVNDWLEVRSHLFVLLKKRSSTLLMRLRLTPRYFAPVYQRSEADAERWAVTVELCEKTARVARDHGAQALFVLIPAPYQTDPEVFAQYVRGFGIDESGVDLEQPNRILGEAMSEIGLKVVDVLEGFRSAHLRGERLYGTVDPHLSTAGHLELVRLVEPVVAAMLGVETGSPADRSATVNEPTKRLANRPAELRR